MFFLNYMNKFNWI